MTKLLYMDDCYLKEFDAKVTEVIDEQHVVLDQTAFYPQGGGQPCDYGELQSKGTTYKVIEVKKKDGKVLHTLDQPGLKQGDKVQGVIDWDRRYKLMRMHTAAHLLSEVFHKETGCLITGNQLDTNKSRVDYSIENFQRETFEECINKANQLIKTNASIKISYMPREEAFKIPSITKLANVLPPAVKELRIVEIENIDRQADGGTHVSKLGEVGEIKLLKIDNKGKKNRRLYFALE